MAAKKTAAATRQPSRGNAKDKKTLDEDRAARAGRGQDGHAGGEPRARDPHARSLSNVSFNEKKRIIELGDKTQSREFFNTSMARKFMQTFLVANGCKTLIDEGKTISIRQMFYMTKHTLPGTSENTFEEQNESDPIIEDLEVGDRRAPRGAAPLRQPGAASSSGSSSSNDAGDQHRPVADGARRLGHPEHLRGRTT